MAGKIANYFKSKNIKEIARDFFLSFVWLIILLFVIDLVSKWVVVNNMNVYTDIAVIENFFYLRLSFNQGAAFGLGNTGDIEWRIFFIAVSAVIGRQIRPRPKRAMKLIESGVTISAAIARSPSFSRSSSSTRMTIRPLRNSSIACSTVANDGSRGDGGRLMAFEW